jgi:hypothetical protein
MWDVEVSAAEEYKLIITPDDQPTITVDNLKVAPFIYSLLNNPDVRELIDSITIKSVLILGRFTPEREKSIITIRSALEQSGYVPITVDFDKPASVDFIEMVSVLASMARFVIADLTDAGVVLPELHRLMERHPTKPVQPILMRGMPLDVLVRDFRRYGSFLPVYEYADKSGPLEKLAKEVIAPAERMVKNQREDG